MKHLRLKGERIAAGLSQADMAAVIGKSVLTYRKKENGKTIFWFEEVIAISKKLGRSINELFPYDKLLKKF